MKTLISTAFALCLFIGSTAASALSLGAEDFVAARAMTCVLAQESLGYLNDDDYAAMAESVLDGYSQEEGDVVYAQALGYFDGLMFGLKASDEREINARLQEYLSSAACTQYTSAQGVSLTL